MHDGTFFRLWACRWLRDKTVPCEPESLVLVNDVALKAPEPRLPLAPNSLAALVGTRRSSGSATGITEWGVIKIALAAASCER